jgi:hypothetical protein
VKTAPGVFGPPLGSGAEMTRDGGTPRTAGPVTVAALVGLGMTWLALVGVTPAAAATPACATTLTVTTPAPPSSTNAAPGPCWTDVTPYPFGSDGNPVDPSSPLCAPNPTTGDQLPCYLTVTSMAFRSWNRGLAATSTTPAGGSDPFGVWIFNGTRWFPDPTFPGSSVCKGNTILWAGKLDYWLVGGPDNWSSLCRFDGVNFLWEPLTVPAATLARVPQVPVTTATAPAGAPTTGPAPGAITSGACYSYDNCWFFGTYGSVVHWNGTVLSDASPDQSAGWLATAFTGAIARVDTSGNPFGLAVGTTSSTPVYPTSSAGTPLPAEPDGTPPPELYGSSGGAFGPLAFAAPTASIPTDPFRTDLVAVDFGPDRQGWVAGNPAGLVASSAGAAGFTGSAALFRPQSRAGPPVDATAPAPLVTSTASGADSTCSAPPTDRFTYSASPSDPDDAFLWSSISVIPGTDDALAGGVIWPASAGPGPDEDRAPEPVIVDATCDGTTTTTRFEIADPNPTYVGSATALTAPADRDGTITAIAANAVNDAWAATSYGGLDENVSGETDAYNEAPHLYRLTDGQPPDAAAGNDDEQRPLTLQFDPAPIPEPPAPTPAPPPPPPVVTQTPTRDPLPSIYDVKSKLVGKKELKLYLTFKLRRPVTLGAQALRDGRVVSSAPLHHFTGKTGQLVLAIDAKAYPTQVRFTSDSPIVALANPGGSLSGTVRLRASATPYRGRRIVSVSFEYSPSGKGLWTTIGTATAAPWTVEFSTSGVAAGRYDLRAVASDNAGVSGVSPLLTKRSIANPSAS